MIFERRNVGVLSGKDVASAKLKGDKDLRMQAGKQLKVPLPDWESQLKW